MREYGEERGYENEPPPDLFAWGEFEPTEPATRVTLSFSPETAVVWEWDGEHYLRTINGTESRWVNSDGETGRIFADTLVVLFARRYTAFPPKSGTAVPAMDTVGSGRVLVFGEGGVSEGTWTRDNMDEMFELTGPDGETMEVPAGIPWVSIFPTNRPVAW